MGKYNNNQLYGQLELVVSSFIMFFQISTLFNVLQSYNGTAFVIILWALIIAYIVTDFVNGVAHMYMDNNTSYSSVVGPYIASFHLHHLKPKLTNRHSFSIYFYESGTKFWLLVYLLILAVIQKVCSLNYAFNVGLVALGIFSSAAEVSHYWCHHATRKNIIVLRLQQCGLLLSKKHHTFHHRFDNMHYAFLNGMTDPLLNLISRYCYKGYKHNADKHTAAYYKLKIAIECAG